jgi:hypothetical protein
MENDEILVQNRTVHAGNIERYSQQCKGRYIFLSDLTPLSGTNRVGSIKLFVLKSRVIHPKPKKEGQICS